MTHEHPLDPAAGNAQGPTDAADAFASAKTAVPTVAGTGVTVQLHGANNAAYTVEILDSAGNVVPGKTASGSLNGSGNASVPFTLVPGSYTSKTTFSGRANPVEHDFIVT